MDDWGSLALRATTGSLLAGHGSQKLFGWFGGYGLQGTAGWLESMGLRPGKPWAVAAGGAEFGGGVLTALGLLNPLGPVAVIGAMVTATATAHKGKPIWVTAGGAELPVTNSAIAVALALGGPGKYSLDNALGLRLPRWLFLVGLAGAVGVAAYASMQSASANSPQQDAARDELQSEGESESSAGTAQTTADYM